MTALVFLSRYGIDPGTIDTILLSHLHGDHFGGLAPLLLEARAHTTVRVTSPTRSQPLRIAGTAGTEERLRQLLDVFGWTGPLESLKDAGADLFICLAYTFDLPSSLLNYRTLMEHRSELTCRRLVLTHIGPELEQRLAGVTEAVAEDGMTVVL